MRTDNGTTIQTDSQPEAIDREQLRHDSPEGMPAGTTTGRKPLLAFTAFIAALVVIIAVVMIASGRPDLAAAVIALGVTIGIVANPVVWAALLRTQEREDYTHNQESHSG